jgi:prevent-host-death family protein
MRTIAAAKFKEQCLALLDEVDADGIVITKRGRPVAKLVPIELESESLIGSLAGKLEIHGDLLSTDLDWDAESRHAYPPSGSRR